MILKNQIMKATLASGVLFSALAVGGVPVFAATQSSAHHFSYVQKIQKEKSLKSEINNVKKSEQAKVKSLKAQANKLKAQEKAIVAKEKNNINRLNTLISVTTNRLNFLKKQDLVRQEKGLPVIKKNATFEAKLQKQLEGYNQQLSQIEQNASLQVSSDQKKVSNLDNEIKKDGSDEQQKIDNLDNELNQVEND